MPRENAAAIANGFDVGDNVALVCFCPEERSVPKYEFLDAIIVHLLLDGSCRVVAALPKGETIFLDDRCEAIINEISWDVIAGPERKADVVVLVTLVVVVGEAEVLVVAVAVVVGWVIWKRHVNVGHATNVLAFSE